MLSKMVIFMNNTINSTCTSCENPLGKPVHPLDKFAYFGNDLGAVYSKEKTVFTFWSPEALAVTVRLFAAIEMFSTSSK